MGWREEENSRERGQWYNYIVRVELTNHTEYVKIDWNLKIKRREREKDFKKWGKRIWSGSLHLESVNVLQGTAVIEKETRRAVRVPKDMDSRTSGWWKVGSCPQVTSLAPIVLNLAKCTWAKTCTPNVHTFTSVTSLWTKISFKMILNCQLSSLILISVEDSTADTSKWRISCILYF